MSEAKSPVRRRAIWRGVAAVGAAAAAAWAHAQPASPAPASTYPSGIGVAFYGGARNGSGFESSGVNRGEPLQLRSGAVAALAFEGPYDDTRLWQLLISRHSTRLLLGSAAVAGAPTEMPLQLTSVHVGGLNYFDGTPSPGGGLRSAVPFVAGGLGLTQLSPNLPGTNSRTRASLNIGIGVEWAPARAVSLRLELRGHAALIRSQGGFFCSGGCTVFVQGDALTQTEVLLGLRLATF